MREDFDPEGFIPSRDGAAVPDTFRMCALGAPCHASSADAGLYLLRTDVGHFPSREACSLAARGVSALRRRAAEAMA
jgi:hypothetical protein